MPEAGPGGPLGSAAVSLADAKAVIEGCIEIGDAAPDALTYQIVLVAGQDRAPVS